MCLCQFLKFPIYIFLSLQYISKYWKKSTNPNNIVMPNFKILLKLLQKTKIATLFFLALKKKCHYLVSYE